MIEKKGADEQTSCNQLKRRIIASYVGHATLVHNNEDICHEEGRFLYIPQDELT